MFSFRRKPTKDPQSPVIKASPSLPELHSTGIPWPENLVDIAAIKEPPIPEEQPVPTAVKTSFQGNERPIPFHKPFRTTSGDAAETGAISSIYMNPGGPPQFEPKKAKAQTSTGGSKYSQRRARIPPTFNLMVVGSKGTGKTSLLRLLLETAEVSPTATLDQKNALDKFLKGSTKPTQSIQAACVEICESRFDRVLFSVIDTPGLDFQEGRELKLERQVNSVIKYIDQQYADTMTEESKVVRQSKGDQHIHLCIYLIDPASIITTEERRALSSFPTKTQSETTISQSQTSEPVPDTSLDDESDGDAQLTMSPTEIRVIRRIAAKSNILPVIAHADSLTDEMLKSVKQAVRTGLSEAGFDLGVFASEDARAEEPATPKRRTRTKFAVPNGNGNGVSNGHEASADSVDGHPEEETTEEGAEDSERTPRSVIKLRPKRHGRPLSRSRSRSRRDLHSLAEEADVPLSPDSNDPDSVANVRFSAHIIAKATLSELMPFALIAPEVGRQQARPKSTTSNDGETSPNLAQADETASQTTDNSTSTTPASIHSGRASTHLAGPPQDLKGVFVRRYRWGTIDILDPNHCDFAAMRTAVLSTHLKLLKTRTKEVLYEKYRTEKLLARRATAQISEEERQRLLEDLGL